MWQRIGSKDVFIVDHHHEVLPAWAHAHRRHKAPLPLVTFDYHTDLHGAFLSYAFVKGGMREGDDVIFQIAEDRLKVIDLSEEKSIQDAVNDLRHDQHIDCAIRLGVISHAFISLGRRDAGMEHSDATIFEYEPCYPGCSKSIHDENCDTPRANLVIDDSVLEARLSAIGNAFQWENSPYILDVDLDVFSNSASISPPSANCFYELIRGADVITIAREKVCVEDVETGCCIEPGLTVDFLEAKLLEHINSALGS
tara:strand:- start:117 stop:878 length:762 start_codon:yes stop_codon:yes gene_type:complete